MDARQRLVYADLIQGVDPKAANRIRASAESEIYSACFLRPGGKETDDEEERVKRAPSDPLQYARKILQEFGAIPPPRYDPLDKIIAELRTNPPKNLGASIRQRFKTRPGQNYVRRTLGLYTRPPWAPKDPIQVEEVVYRYACELNHGLTLPRGGVTPYLEKLAKDVLHNT